MRLKAAANVLTGRHLSTGTKPSHAKKDEMAEPTANIRRDNLADIVNVIITAVSLISISLASLLRSS